MLMFRPRVKLSVLSPNSLARRSSTVKSPYSLLASQKPPVRRQRVLLVVVRLVQEVKVVVAAPDQAVDVVVAVVDETPEALVDTVS